MQTEHAKDPRSSKGTCREEVGGKERQQRLRAVSKPSPSHSPPLDVILPAGGAVSSEEEGKQLQKRYRRSLLLVSVVSLVVGGALGLLARPTAPSGSGAHVTPPPGWTAICAPVNADVLPTAKSGHLRVYVSGAVLRPQVVTVSQGSLVNDALAAAGGAASGADLAAINLAAPVRDHQQIVVPYKPQSSLSEEESGPVESVAEVTTEVTTLNINRADAEALQQLPRIGPALAERIITYREDYGPFAAPEDIQKVSGIGRSTFEEIAPYIVVE